MRENDLLRQQVDTHKSEMQRSDPVARLTRRECAGRRGSCLFLLILLVCTEWFEIVNLTLDVYRKLKEIERYRDEKDRLYAIFAFSPHTRG